MAVVRPTGAPFRAGALPLLLGKVSGPLSGAASLRSPRGAPRKQQQTASGYPIGKVLPVSQRRAGKDNGSNAQCCRPSQRPRRGYPFRVPTAPPLALAAPAPHPRTIAAAAAGRAFPLGRSCGPAPMLAGHALAQRPPPLSSLHDPRHRSCTGSRLLAALPALHALRHCSGKAAAAGSGLELRNETESSTAPGPNSAHNAASVIRNCKQLPCGYAALV